MAEGSSDEARSGIGMRRAAGWTDVNILGGGRSMMADDPLEMNARRRQTGRDRGSTRSAVNPR
jgi:hypothetical protein